MNTFSRGNVINISILNSIIVHKMLKLFMIKLVSIGYMKVNPKGLLH